MDEQFKKVQPRFWESVEIIFDAELGGVKAGLSPLAFLLAGRNDTL